jgi:sec-independent protein translocase protein TatB
MPQIGWFEILVVIVVAILVIGPKDFPIVIRKIGNWTGSIKRYFREVQKDITDTQESFREEISFDEENNENNKKNE